MAVIDALERDELELQKETLAGFKKNAKPDSAAERCWDGAIYWMNNRLKQLGEPSGEKNTSSAITYNCWDLDKYEGEYEKYVKINSK